MRSRPACRGPDALTPCLSWTDCPFCKRVKALFAKLGEPICTIELDATEDGPLIQGVLVDLTRQRTVPSVFIGGQHVGGNDDTQAKAASGELQKLIASAKAA